MPVPLEKTGREVENVSRPICFREDPYYSREAYRRRFLVSVLFSILLNFFFLWAFLVSNKNGWLRLKPPPPRREIPKLVLIRKPPPPPLPAPPSRTFLETDPSQAVKEAPQNAKFYSEQNTAATQVKPSEVKSDEVPLAEGKNTQTMETENVLSHARPPSPPPQNTKPAEATRPSPPPQPQTPPPAPPLPNTPSGLELLRPTPAEKFLPSEKPTPPSPQTPPTPQPSPSAPMAPPAQHEIPALQSRLEGGVKRTGALSFNSVETPYAAYDKKVVAKIGSYWHMLVDGKDFGERLGSVKVDFKLLENGRIENIKINESSIKGPLEILCIRAIQESAPFEPFPEPVKVFFGNHRDVTFYFYYY